MIDYLFLSYNSLAASLSKSSALLFLFLNNYYSFLISFVALIALFIENLRLKFSGVLVLS
jgi:hypothetical protein